MSVIKQKISQKVSMKDTLIPQDGTGLINMPELAHNRKMIGVLERINPFTGNVISREFNDIIIPGSNYILEQMFKRRSTFGMTTLSTDLNINASALPTQDNLKDEFIFGFVLGMGGTEAADIIRSVQFKDKNVNTIYPIRVVPVTNDLIPTEAAKYGMKKQVGDKFYYYAKRFEANSVIRNLFTDGSEIPPNIDQLETNLGLLVFAEAVVGIGSDDCREYFMDQFGTIDNCRFNSIALVAGFVANNDFAGVRAVTKINMSNMKLDDLDKAYTYTYRVYCI